MALDERQIEAETKEIEKYLAFQTQALSQGVQRLGYAETIES